jgi:hypothetical protein
MKRKSFLPYSFRLSPMLSTVKPRKVSVSGWRINGTYEFNPYYQKWSYGLSAGYLKLKGPAADMDGLIQYQANWE